MDCSKIRPQSRHGPARNHIDRKPFETAMTGIYAKSNADPALSQMIKRIQQVE